MRVALGLCCLLAGWAAAGPAAAAERSAVQRDVEGYAIASCLTDQDQAYLKDQGDAWASVILQRGHGDPDTLAAVAAAVKAELARGDMAVIHTEGTGDKALPLLTCNEIIDKPAVRKAIRAAIVKLTPAYRRR